MATEINGVTVLECSPDGQVVDSDRATMDLIADAMGHDAELVALPVERLPDEFFSLRSGLAGLIAQKFVNYRMRLAIVGDVTAHVDRSTALRDFVRETNRGSQLWFVADGAELRERLGG
jgi:hypothetical protein